MPLGESFQATIRSNKSIMLDKSRRFRKTSGGFDWSKSPKMNLPAATTEQLEEIRLRLKRENRERTIKEFVLIGLITVVLVIVAVYILF
ncbi:hypothetical protein [Algibacter sp. R77976]|uniref:hypothetical protein n=1 Tax=Algibacter sp. R77976 TaxID=3093873 RepID=UPI0037C74DAF